MAAALEKPQTFMERALAEASLAASRGEVPVGAVLVEGAGGRVIAVAGTRTRGRCEGSRVPAARRAAESEVFS